MKCCPLTFLPCASNQSPPPPSLHATRGQQLLCGKTPLEFLLRDSGEVLFSKRDGFCESFPFGASKNSLSLPEPLMINQFCLDS